MKKVAVLIIGGGPAGISAAIWCQRLNIDHLLIEGKNELGGQLDQIKNEVIDYPGLFDGKGYEIKNQFISHFKKLGCYSMCNMTVNTIDLKNKKVTCSSPTVIKEIMFDYLIVATGASARLLGVRGEKEMLQRGEVYSASKDRHLFKGKKVIVVGGGDRAFEGAVLLADAGADVTLVHRSKKFRSRDEYVLPAKEHPNITIKLDSRIIEIIGNQKISGVKIKTEGTEPYILHAEAVFVRIGTKPNSELFSNLFETNEEGYIITDENGKTSEKYIYAIGDVCTAPTYSSIITAVGQGMRVAKLISLELQKKNINSSNTF